MQPADNSAPQKNPFSYLWRKKALSTMLAQGDASHNKLKRALGKFNLLSIAIGSIIGAGIFVMTGQAAAFYSGPAIALSFIIAAMACTFTALCYAELASMIPISGSAYTYSYASFGELIGWLIGWNLILEYLFSVSTVAVGWSGYFLSFLSEFGISFSPEFISAPISFDPAMHSMKFTGAILNAPAMLITLVITVILIIGIRESASVNNIMVMIKIGVLLLFMAVGAWYINPDNWKPFIPENTGSFGQFGWSGVFRAAGIIFFAYIGFDTASTTAQEAKNPQKDLPFSIIGSLIVCTILYIGFGVVLTGMVPYQTLNDPAPVAVALKVLSPGLHWIGYIIKLGAIAGLTSIVLVTLLAQTRVFYVMANDGLLPSVFSKVHKRFHTPHWSTLITGGITAIAAGLLPLDLLGELVSMGTLLAFTFVSAGVLVLRRTNPKAVRPFKTPFFPVIPILGIITPLFVMVMLPFDTWIRLIVWVVFGLVIYFFYGRWHSKLNTKRQN